MHHLIPHGGSRCRLNFNCNRQEQSPADAALFSASLVRSGGGGRRNFSQTKLAEDDVQMSLHTGLFWWRGNGHFFENNKKKTMFFKDSSRLKKSRVTRKNVLADSNDIRICLHMYVYTLNIHTYTQETDTHMP